MNLFSLLDQSATRYPDRPALFLGDRCTSNYCDLRNRALALAGAMLKFARQGDRVAIISKNCPEYVEVMFGAWAAGLAITPINSKLHPREWADIITDSKPRLVFVSAELQPDLDHVIPKDDCAPISVKIGGKLYDELLSATIRDVAEVEPDSLAWLFFTSGTTGRSKGAMLSHRNLFAMTIAYLADFESVEPDHSIIHSAPMSHGSGLYALPYIARSARHVVPESAGYDPDEFIQICRSHPNCASFLAPTMVQRLRTTVQRTNARPTNLRTVIYGGGPMYIEEIRNALECLGDVFVQVYGQGEAPMTITGMRRSDFEDRSNANLGSVGWPRSGVDVRVAGPDGRVLSPGEVGEVICRGDVVMSGYWNDAEGSRNALKRGWLWTGDLGSFDDQGRLTLRDRSKDVIISGGANIYPREVEEVLLAHPGVSEVCVVGIPDAEWGEKVAAFIVLESDANTSEAELDSLCLERIARFKRPRKYTFCSSLPKNNYGKVLRRVLISKEDSLNIDLT